MAKTTEMRLVDLMVLKQDISKVLLYLGKSGNFQFQSSLGQGGETAKGESAESAMYKRLEQARSFLGVDDSGLSIKEAGKQSRALVRANWKDYIKQNIIFHKRGGASDGGRFFRRRKPFAKPRRFDKPRRRRD